ncbi:MAG: CDP-diacylglycerol--glycerol-3-phosphate 3-phosphatidyltransferase [Clostridia bacterium]|jgi:CDP-diacylglycerol--glycerol-3-phosphate 3-phosphatidyltransferase|nr:CDP-diacylglycerol--glycerol-3-phosphate 3-phosphatidyltransferase [Clostridia bacterium]
MKMNLPNKLTVLRMIMIPFFMFIIMFPVLGQFWSRIAAALLFGLTALTDMLDGKIARKHNLVTDFGKFMDPVADKLMTIGGYIALLTTISYDRVFFMVFAWATFVVILREIAVTSLRMIVSNKSGGVLAAAILGKIKTVSQIVCILVMILEPAFFGKTFIGEYHVLSYVTVAFMVFMTIWSGLDYVKAYWPLLDPEK